MLCTDKQILSLSTKHLLLYRHQFHVLFIRQNLFLREARSSLIDFTLTLFHVVFSSVIFWISYFSDYRNVSKERSVVCCERLLPHARSNSYKERPGECFNPWRARSGISRAKILVRKSSRLFPLLSFVYICLLECTF